MTAKPQKEDTLADLTVALMHYLRNIGLEPDEGFLQEALQQLTQTVVELEAAKQIGAGRYERTPERKTYRNGRRDRVWETRAGEIPLRIPKVRDGIYPGLPQGRLPEPAGAPAAEREGLAGRDTASLRGRGKHSPGG